MTYDAKRRDRYRFAVAAVTGLATCAVAAATGAATGLAAAETAQQQAADTASPQQPPPAQVYPATAPTTRVLT
ncbi:hypothetical protein, partial [Nocardioides pelophilus]|uniref:hypothetical protein n=1 Tax=Nocardioides pelophilus TaxID=2172019 RepID=UPI001C8230F2